jgi:hypothetical protein
MLRNPFKKRGAVDFGQRSPFAGRVMIGVPPAYFNPPKTQDNGGSVTLHGVPLPKYAPGTPQGEAKLTPIPGESPIMPMPMYDAAMYGDAIVFGVTFAAAGELLVLPRPNAWRISLLIVNSTVVGNIFYTFDRVADNLSCVPIVAGGNRLFDLSVPQGDLHIFSSGAGTIIIEYINRDIRQESYR